MEQNSGKPGLVFHASEEKLEKLETQIELPDRVRVRSANIVSNRVQNKTLELRTFKKKTIRTIPGLPHICTLLWLFGGRPKCTKKSAIAVVAVRKNQHLTGRLNVHQRKVPPSCIVSRSHLSRLNSAL